MLMAAACEWARVPWPPPPVRAPPGRTLPCHRTISSTWDPAHLQHVHELAGNGLGRQGRQAGQHRLERSALRRLQGRAVAGGRAAAGPLQQGHEEAWRGGPVGYARGGPAPRWCRAGAAGPGLQVPGQQVAGAHLAMAVPRSANGSARRPEGCPVAMRRVFLAHCCCCSLQLHCAVPQQAWTACLPTSLGRARTSTCRSTLRTCCARLSSTRRRSGVRAATQACVPASCKRASGMPARARRQTAGSHRAAAQPTRRPEHQHCPTSSRAGQQRGLSQVCGSAGSALRGAHAAGLTRLTTPPRLPPPPQVPAVHSWA